MWTEIISAVFSVASIFFINGEGFSTTLKTYIYQVVVIGGQISQFFPVDTLVDCLKIVLAFEIVLMIVKFVIVLNEVRKI